MSASVNCYYPYYQIICNHFQGLMDGLNLGYRRPQNTRQLSVLLRMKCLFPVPTRLLIRQEWVSGIRIVNNEMPATPLLAAKQVHARYQVAVSTTKCLSSLPHWQAYLLLALSPGSRCLRIPLLAKRVCSATGSGIADSRQTQGRTDRPKNSSDED